MLKKIFTLSNRSYEKDTDDFDIWYKYDIEYIENWSLYLDIKILLRTFKAVIEKSNAGK